MSDIRKFFVCGRRNEEDMISDNESIDDVVRFLNGTPLDKNAEIVVVPPVRHMDEVVSRLTKPNMTVGANPPGPQCLDAASAQKVKDSGGQWVILGHMERRRPGVDIYKGIAGEIRQAMDSGLKVMVCVGETLKEREEVRTLEVVARQLRCIAEGVEEWGRVVVVYQPLWALGTCKTITTREVVQVFKEIRQWMADTLYPPSLAITTRIIYGGLVCGNRCGDFAVKEDIDGFLVEGTPFSFHFLRMVNSRKNC
ncbi:hypothetical protein ACOMHN_010216 [Nucella lapillus]